MKSLLPILTVTACITASCAQAPEQAEVVTRPAQATTDPVHALDTYPPMQTKKSKQGDVDLVFVPAGEFTMGTNKPTEIQRDSITYVHDDGPIHEVNLDGYWISKKPITVGQVRAFCQATGTDDPYLGGDDSQPAVDITWAIARAYCQWQGGDLPTEAQWEKAARGTDARAYPWGNDFSPDKVRQANVSPYGCEDMVGVVYQWCLDAYSAQGYSGLASTNPISTRGDGRVARGSSGHRIDADQCRAAVRTAYEPTVAYDECGVRLAVTAE